MNTTDKKIAEALAKFGEPMAGNVWRVQGTVVIYHKTLERIAAQAQIQFETPTIVRAERDEAVILVTGRMGDRVEWSIGEALVGINYRVSGKQAAYVYAMAEKRAKDRVILKLIGLQDVVPSEEAHEVESPPSSSNENTPGAERDRDQDLVLELKGKLDSTHTADAVISLMRAEDTQHCLQGLAPGLKDEVRIYAKARLVALGWTPDKAA